MASKLRLIGPNGNELCISSGSANTNKLLETTDFKYIRDTVSQLSTIPQPQDGEVALVKGYHDNADNAGGTFIYRASMPKSSHNGGTIIDPSKTFPSFWNDSTQVTDWFTADSAGNGCWERVYDGAVNVKWFGAKGDRITDDSLPIQTAIKNSKEVFSEDNSVYLISYTEIDNDITIRKINFLQKDSIRFKNAFKIIDCNFEPDASNLKNSIIIENSNNSFKIVGSKFTNFASCGVYGIGGNISYGIIKDNTFDNCGNNNTVGFNQAIRLDNASSTIIEGNYAINCQYWGFLLRSTDLTGAKLTTNCKVINNYIYAKDSVNGSQGMSVSGGYGILIKGNTISDFTDNGIDTQYCENIIVDNNNVINCKDGVFIGDRSASNILVSNNNFTSCQRAVRAVLGAFDNMNIDSVNISNNIIRYSSSVYSNAQIMVAIDSTSNSCYIRNVVINGNTFFQPSVSDSIILLQSNTKTIVSNNSFSKGSCVNVIKVIGTSNIASDSVIINGNMLSDINATGVLVTDYSNRTAIHSNIFTGLDTAVSLLSGASATYLKGNLYRSNTNNIVDNSNWPTIDDQIDYNLSKVLLHLPTSDPKVSGQQYVDSNNNILVSQG